MVDVWRPIDLPKALRSRADREREKHSKKGCAGEGGSPERLAGPLPSRILPGAGDMLARVLFVVLVFLPPAYCFGEAPDSSNDAIRVTEEDWTLGRLLALGQTEIVELWKRCPAATLEEMNGLFLGLIPNADDAVARERIDRFMYDENSVRGYWIGKAYKRTSETTGEGYNRWRHPGGKFVHGQRFATEMGTSFVDGRPSLIMYYEAYNPGLRLVDEIRKLDDNIYLGIGTTPQPDGSRKLFGHFAYIGPIHEWVEYEAASAR